jgi:hypothetical protein
MPDLVRVGWFRSEWIDSGWPERHRYSAWHFNSGQQSQENPWHVEGVCGYEPGLISIEQEWSSEPEPDKLPGSACSRCRHLIGR